MKCQIYYCYKATNDVNGKMYIGFATNPIKRWSQHKTDAEKNKGFVFHDAIRKYGWEHFRFEVICCGKNKREMLEHVEPALIEQYKSLVNQNGYNVYRRVIGPACLTDETRHKISLAVAGEKNGFFGKKHSEATKAIMSELKKGKPSHRKGAKCSEESKQKMSKSHKGTILSEEHKAKIGVASLGRHHTEETKQKMREVVAKRSPEHYIRKIQCARNIAKLTGLQFFEDKPCNICSSARRYTANGQCVHCKLEKGKLQYGHSKISTANSK